MEIRSYRQEDIKVIAELFYNTVHSVNAADYTEEQLDAWADGNINLEAWDRSFREHMTLVAVMASDEEEGNGQIVSIIPVNDYSCIHNGPLSMERKMATHFARP